MSGYEIHNPKIQKMLQDIGVNLARKMAPGYGFALTIFSFGEGGDFFYCSNANRDDMIKMLDEWKAKLISDKESKDGRT